MKPKSELATTVAAVGIVSGAAIGCLVLTVAISTAIIYGIWWAAAQAFQGLPYPSLLGALAVAGGIGLLQSIFSGKK